MIKTLITEFPLSEVLVERTVTEEKIRKYTYSKEEVDALIADAVKEADTNGDGVLQLDEFVAMMVALMQIVLWN